MPPWLMARSMPSGCATCWQAACRPPTHQCSRSMSAPGRAATLSARPSAATTTIPRAIRPASQSSLAGPSSGSPTSASTGTPGLPRWTPVACIHWTTLTRPPQRRSAGCSPGCPPADRSHCLCSTPATTPPSSPSTWPRSPSRCWCGCGRTAASTPTRHHRPLAGVAGRAATGPSSTAPTRPLGRPRPPATSWSTTSTAP
jgi:hypothetical protein